MFFLEYCFSELGTFYKNGENIQYRYKYISLKSNGKK